MINTLDDGEARDVFYVKSAKGKLVPAQYLRDRDAPIPDPNPMRLGTSYVIATAGLWMRRIRTSGTTTSFPQGILSTMREASATR